MTLPCRVIGKSGILQWTKDDFGLGAHRNLSGYERYAMVGSDEEGKYYYFFLFNAYEIAYSSKNFKTTSRLLAASDSLKKSERSVAKGYSQIRSSKG